MSIPEKKLAACVEVPGPPSEPLASVIRQPLSGSAPASARATCAEPPRGKKKSAESTRPRGRARSVGGRSRPAAASGLPRPACSTGAILLEREDGASAPASSYAADRVSECVAVAFWRNRDALPRCDRRWATPAGGTNSTGAGTARPRGRCRPSEIGRKAAAALFRTLGTDWVLGLKDMQGPVRTRESAQDLSWLCSLPCGNSGTAPSTASRSKPSSASPHRRLHEDGCAE